MLGPLEVYSDGAPLALGGQKQRQLLGLLLLRPGEVVSTDRIIDALWGEHPPKTAATSLQNFVSQLRKVMPERTLVTKAPGYAVNLDGGTLDTAQFEELVACARGMSAEERSRRLREALSLFYGSPLADFGFDEWAQNEIGRLEDLRIAALEDRIDGDLELGRHAELVGELEALVKKNPHRERLRGHLMLALYRAGRQAEALQAYQDARRTLVEELGIEPSPELQELHGAILRQERRLSVSGSGESAGPDHYDEVVSMLRRGRVVIALGANVNLSGHHNGVNGGVLAGRALVDHLARLFECPHEHARELAHIAQYVALVRGLGPLYDELHALYNRDFPPGPVQRGLAAAARALRDADVPGFLVVTTNYDHTLEQAFAAEGVEYDVVAYIAAGRDRGKFLHVPPDGDARVVEIPNAYADVTPDKRPVILKIHGQVDRDPSRRWDSFVVSEDDHIGYLAQAELPSVVPVTLAAKLRRSHFLFLGYALDEWSLRVFLQRVWGDEQVAYRSWAVHPSPGRIDAELWRQRGISVFDVPVDDYVEELARCCGAAMAVPA